MSVQLVAGTDRINVPFILSYQIRLFAVLQAFQDNESETARIVVQDALREWFGPTHGPHDQVLSQRATTEQNDLRIIANAISQPIGAHNHNWRVALRVVDNITGPIRQLAHEMER